MEASNLECGISNTVDGETVELPRPPLSNFDRITRAGLRPQRISNLNEAITNTSMVVENLRRHRRDFRLVSYAFVFVLVLLFISYAVFLFLYIEGVIYFR